MKEQEKYELRSTHYWMTKVYCNGKESTMYQCQHAGWKKHTCKSKPVYLNCKRSPFLNESRFDKVLMAVSFIFVIPRTLATFI